MGFGETELETLIMGEFEDRDYEHVCGDTIERREDEVLLVRDLETYLRTAYAAKGITDSEIRAIIMTLPVFDRGGYVNNRETFRKIRNGFDIRRADKKSTLRVNLIDFVHPEKNIFKIVNQYRIAGVKVHRIPDAIVFVNGIPLVVLEFKSTTKEDATIYNAYEQINTRCTRDIPNLFVYNAFTVISDGENSKIGTHFSGYEHYYSWNKVNSSDRRQDGIGSLDTIMDGVFNKARLLSIVKDFVFFPDESGKQEKIVCRYPQYFGATSLYKHVMSHLKPDGDGKGGTYFGTTGCGKSYTMLFLSRLLMKSPEMRNPTIVLITDRNNLDHQLYQQFLVAKRFLGDENVRNAATRDDLKALLSGCTSGGVFHTTIQKFSEAEDALSERNNIVVISDEAHRSTLNMEEVDRVVGGKKKHIAGFGRILHDSLPNATYVGFTGTPIDETMAVFGDIVDQYTMVESEADHITSKLVYEGRTAKVNTDPAILKAIDDYYRECEAMGSNPYQIEKSKKELAKLDNVINGGDRLKKVAKDFIQHYENRTEEGSTVAGKCMFVCSSRLIAYNFCMLLKEFRPDWFVVRDGDNEGLSEDKKAEPIEMVKMVATRGKDDPKEMYEFIGDSEYKRNLEVQFKKINSNFKIAVVVDMWLTGFDVPFLDAIYIDKPIQKHNLIQAISRVNRIYEGKEYGLVVDYLGIKSELDKALKKYTNGYKGEGLDTSEDFVKAMRIHLDILDKMFFDFDASDYYSDDEKKQFRCLGRAMEHVQRTKEDEQKFMREVRSLKTAYNNCTYSENITKEERDRVYFYTGVRSLLAKLIRGDAPDTAVMNIKVRQMLERAMNSDEVVQIIVESNEITEDRIELLSDEYLEKIRKMPGVYTKFKVLERLLKVTIGQMRKTNKLMADQFSARFNKVVEVYNDRHYRTDDIAMVIQEMVEIITDAMKSAKSGNEMGLSMDEKAFYDILVYIVDEYDFEYDRAKLPDIAKQLKKCADEACSTLDWLDRADVQAELKVEIVMILAENGFPPEVRDGVYQKIFQQLEVYKDNS